MNGDWYVHTTRFGTPQIVLGPEEAVSAINMIDSISGQVNNMAPRSIEKSEPGRSFGPRPVIPIDTIAAEHLVFLESMASGHRDRYR